MKARLFSRTLGLLLFGAALLLAGLDGAAQEPSAKQDAELSVSLRDGSTVRGRADIQQIEVDTVYGKLTIPMSEVSRIRMGAGGSRSTARNDEVEAKAFSVRGTINLNVLELKTAYGTLRFAREDLVSITSVWAIATAPSLGTRTDTPAPGLGGFSTAAPAAGVHLRENDPDGQPVPGERLLSTFTFEGSFKVYGHEPVPQVNGFDYYFSPVKLDSELRGKKVRVSRVEVTASGKSNGKVVQWDVEVFGGPTGFDLPVGQFIQTHMDPLQAFSNKKAPIYARMTKTETDFVRSVTIPPALRKDVPLEDGLRAQVFLWTANNLNCNLDIHTVSVRFFGEVL